MKLSTIINEIRTRCPDLDNRVYGLAEYANADETVDTVLPAVFVLPESDKPDEPTGTQKYRQVVDFNFLVTVRVSTETDEQGGEAFDAAMDIRTQIFRAILGWEPYGKTGEWVVYRGLQVEPMTRSRLDVSFAFSIEENLTDDDSRHGYDIDRLDDFLRVHTDVDLAKPDGAIDAKFDINVREGM